MYLLRFHIKLIFSEADLLAKEAAMIFNNSITLFNIAFLLINVLNVAEGWLKFFISSMYPALLAKHSSVWQALLLNKTCCYAAGRSSAHDNYRLRVEFSSCDCICLSSPEVKAAIVTLLLLLFQSRWG